MLDSAFAPLSATSPLRLHGSFRSSDLAEIRRVAAATQHPLSIDAPKRGSTVRFRLHHHPLARIALTHATLESEGELRVSAAPLEDHYYLQIPLRGTARVRHGDRVVGTAPGKTAVLLSPGPDTTMRSFDGFEELTLEISAAAVSRAWTALTGESLHRPIVFEPAFRLDTVTGAPIARLTRFLIDEVSRPTSALTAGPTLNSLEDGLLLCLLQGQPHSADQRLPLHPSKSMVWLVCAAESWMETHAAQPITMGAVAEAQGTTLRSLQRAFRLHRAYAPRDFLRRVRLGRAHARLRRGDAATVTQIALESGIRHHGRFSHDYRAHFGVPPSSTLRRARRRGRMPADGVANRIDSPCAAVVQSPHRLDPESCGFCAGEFLFT